MKEAIWEDNQMTLMRAFSKVDKDGKIKLPGNIQRAAELKEGQLVELKIVGASRKKNVLVSARGSAR
jgi:bifunctional DNA-binding transcriptional regulator/antitoxin component of YhaV-PrlF toxin-antitoxin module